MYKAVVFHFLLLITCLVGVTGCFFSSEEQSAKAPEKTYTLVFLDKTMSVPGSSDYVEQKYKQQLTDIITTNLQTTGDKLEIYFVHENTSKARALSVEVRAEKEESAGTSATDQEMAANAYQMVLQKEKNIYLRQALAKLAQGNSGRSNQYTDLWASLPVIEKASQEGLNLKVYYFSDMVESSKGDGRRDFHVKPPVSADQAKQWASEDLKQLTQYAIGTPEVTVVSPFDPLASSKENNPAVMTYWQTIFDELAGVSIAEL